MTATAVDMALAILARAVLGLIRGEDMNRWVRQLEAILSELKRSQSEQGGPLVSLSPSRAKESRGVRDG